MTFIIKNGAASCASVQLANAATGHAALWNNTLAADDWLRFDSETQRVDVSGDDGANWSKSNGGLVGTIPGVVGGVSNVLTLTGPTTGTYDYTFTAKG